MKTSSINIKKVVTITGLFLGAFAMSVFAGSWTAAPLPAPDGNTGAPINVTSSDQSKEGRLSVFMSALPTAGWQFEVGGKGKMTGLWVTGRTITDSLTIGGVDFDKAGYVLTNDGTGDALWKAPSAVISVGTINNSAEVDLSWDTVANYRTKKCSESGVCKRDQDLGVQGFCALTKQQVKVYSKDASFSDGDEVTCNLTQNSSTKVWTLTASRLDDDGGIPNSGTTDVGIICRASCFGGGAITAQPVP
jgi:hypothetical protein